MQAEFSRERRMLYGYIRQDALLGQFFEPFIFENLPSADISAQQAYLSIHIQANRTVLSYSTENHQSKEILISFAKLTVSLGSDLPLEVDGKSSTSKDD